MNTLRPFAMALTMAAALSCRRADKTVHVAPTCASVDVLHPGVTVLESDRHTRTPFTVARVERAGRVRTSAEGRALIRTDDGLELRLAGDTEVSFDDSHPRVEHGRVFVRAWGDDERTLGVGQAITLGIGEAALEVERSADDTVRVIEVRGEIAWRMASTQGRLAQGEALEGRGTPTVHPAMVWDDWTGGVASPQGELPHEARGSGQAYLHGATGEAPVPLAINDHRVTVRVEGDVAITTVSQRFFNGAEQTAPVEYRIRIPDDALVAGFLVEREGQIARAVPGTVASLNESTGTSALLAHPEGGLFARLEPLAPGRTVRCELQYVQWLTHDDGRRQYVYPMGDPEDPPFIGEFRFEFSAVRAGASAIRGPAGAHIEGNTLRLARSDFRPRGDLAVDLFDQHAGDRASARMWRAAGNRVERDAVLVDVSLPAPTPRGTDLVLLLDDSAATEPGALSVARVAIDAIVHSVGPDDRVALMFGDLRARPADGAAGELTAVTDDRRQAILDAVARAHTGGGSNLGSMISGAYTRLDPHRNGAVIYLGDAMPSIGTLDPAHLVDQTLRAAPDLRLYVLALGDEAHPEVLERLTRRGGFATHAGDAAEAVREAHRLVAHATRPVFRDVVIRLDGVLEHPFPERIEQWVVGDPLHVVGDRVGEVPSTVRVTARTPDGDRNWTLPVAIDSVRDLGDIHRRIGLARLRALDAVGASRAALADLGVRFGLITATSALVVGAPNVGSNDDGVTGYDVAASLWPGLGLATRLPRLGIEYGVQPRGINTLGEWPEYPMIADDESGWIEHYPGEGAGLTGMMGFALEAASPAADACVNRARSVRPSLAGNVTIDATIAADGHVTAAVVRDSTLHDLSTESCIRRAVAVLTLPPPSLYGETPGVATHTFEFAPSWDSPHGRACPPTAHLPRSARMVLWRERIAARGDQLGTLWNEAGWRCELRTWDDRAALLALMVSRTSEPTALLAVRSTLDKDGRTWLDRAVARRFGASRLWGAWRVSLAAVNWDALIRQLTSATVPIERKIELAQAYRALAPWDIDVRLRLMSLYEQAGRMPEARRVADDLRTDPFADARVRARVGEMLIRAGDRDEGLRALTEMAEFAPYDPRVRARLGDLLLTFGGDAWAEEAYAQCETLAALRPGDGPSRVRMALAAIAAHREDEGLRLLRQVAEESHDDDGTPAVEALLVSEVGALLAHRAESPAVQSWLRVARLTDAARHGALLARWTYPDLGLDIDAMQPGDTAFVPISHAADAMSMRVYTPGTALEGSRIRIRGASGLDATRTVTVHITLVVPGERSPRVVERDVTLRASAPTVALMVRSGAIIDDPTPVAPTAPPTRRALAMR